MWWSPVSCPPRPPPRIGTARRSRLKLPRRLAAWRAHAGRDKIARAHTPGHRHAGVGAAGNRARCIRTRRVSDKHIWSEETRNVGTTTATATTDAGDHARGRRRMAPDQCRTAPACNVPPQSDGPGAGRHRTALDRRRHRGRGRASAALRSVQHGQPLSHPSELCAAGRSRCGSRRGRSRSISPWRSSTSRCASADSWPRPKKTISPRGWTTPTSPVPPGRSANSTPLPTTRPPPDARPPLPLPQAGLGRG